MSDYTQEQQALMNGPDFCPECAAQANLVWESDFKARADFGACGHCKQAKLLPSKGGWLPGGDDG